MYLRALTSPDVFPLMKPDQMDPGLRRIIKVEVLREAATLVMLAAVALAVTGSGRRWLAAFALVFGIWDLSFYASLRALIGWPESLMTWDLLFLLPVPWIGPVLSPVLVAISLAAGGLIALLREPPRVSGVSWTMLMLGGAIVLAAFMWNGRHISNGGLPRHFPWGIFATGEALGMLGFAMAYRGSPSRLAVPRRRPTP